jgi:CheY-like chemotaxis protein/anti-sigma regulatory factor (Ser/Thr protein kinase)
METARPMIESRRQELVVRMPPAPVWVSGDFVRLSQVIGNLLNNAAKYTQEKGRIEISAAANEGEAVIVVRDNGAGIDPELLPQVFDLFVQGERSLDRSQGGLGIGLTLVRHLVELHQGSVEAHSRGAGRGSMFKVRLPCISAVGAKSTAPVVEPAPAPSVGRRVLVVDDNVDAAESIAMYLRLEGHEVKVVINAYHALPAAAVFAPHAVLLDIGLPGISGYEIARRLRQQPAHEAAVLIALTGYGQKDDRERAASAGFDYHFVKPADPSAVQAAIERGRASGSQSSGGAAAVRP